MIWLGGRQYDGLFQRGLRHGKNGVQTDPNGDRYEGTWENDLMEGLGKVFYGDRRTYVGKFQNGRLHGIGVMTFPNNFSYQGQFSKGKVEGKGTL